jgi:hypothetical protein
MAQWQVSLRKDRATWTYYTRNPLGGGFGSNYCGPQYIALIRATENIPEGQQYDLVVNGKQRGTQTKGAKQ